MMVFAFVGAVLGGIVIGVVGSWAYRGASAEVDAEEARCR